MGENPTETLSEIEASRQRIQQDIDLLASRLPEGEELARRAKLAGGLAAAAGVGIVVAYVASKRSLKQRRRRRDAGRQADALIDAFKERQLVVDRQVAAAPVLEIDSDAGDTIRNTVLIAALAAVVAAVVRLVRGGG